MTEFQQVLRSHDSSSSLKTGRLMQRPPSVRDLYSAVLHQPLLEQPDEESTEECVPDQVPNLLDQRKKLIAQRPMSTSFKREQFESSPLAGPTSIRSVSRENAYENLTLAERKLVIQNHKRHSSEQLRPLSASSSPTSSDGPASKRDLPSQLIRRSFSAQSVLRSGSPVQSDAGRLNAPQPRREPSFDEAKQTRMLAQWRRSLAEDATALSGKATASPTPVPGHEGQTPSAIDTMTAQKASEAMQREQVLQKRASRESAMDLAMRTSQMHMAHNEALRRLQAKANRHAG